MSNSQSLPAPTEIAERIKSCREEMAALRKLLRISQTISKANQARSKREGGAHG